MDLNYIMNKDEDSFLVEPGTSKKFTSIFLREGAEKHEITDSNIITQRSIQSYHLKKWKHQIRERGFIQCPLGECDRLFYSAFELERHFVRCNREGSCVKCSICSKYIASNEMKQHYYSAHNFNPEPRGNVISRVKMLGSSQDVPAYNKEGIKKLRMANYQTNLPKGYYAIDSPHVPSAEFQVNNSLKGSKHKSLLNSSQRKRHFYETQTLSKNYLLLKKKVNQFNSKPFYKDKSEKSSSDEQSNSFKQAEISSNRYPWKNLPPQNPNKALPLSHHSNDLCSQMSSIDMHRVNNSDNINSKTKSFKPVIQEENFKPEKRKYNLGRTRRNNEEMSCASGYESDESGASVSIKRLLPANYKKQRIETPYFKPPPTRNETLNYESDSSFSMPSTRVAKLKDFSDISHKKYILKVKSEELQQTEEAVMKQEGEAENKTWLALQEQEVALLEKEASLKQREAAARLKIERAKRLMEESRNLSKYERDKEKDRDVAFSSFQTNIRNPFKHPSYFVNEVSSLEDEGRYSFTDSRGQVQDVLPFNIEIAKDPMPKIEPGKIFRTYSRTPRPKRLSTCSPIASPSSLDSPPYFQSTDSIDCPPIKNWTNSQETLFAEDESITITPMGSTPKPCSALTHMNILSSRKTFVKSNSRGKFPTRININMNSYSIKSDISIEKIDSSQSLSTVLCGTNSSQCCLHSKSLACKHKKDVDSGTFSDIVPKRSIANVSDLSQESGSTLQENQFTRGFSPPSKDEQFFKENSTQFNHPYFSRSYCESMEDCYILPHNQLSNCPDELTDVTCPPISKFDLLSSQQSPLSYGSASKLQSDIDITNNLEESVYQEISNSEPINDRSKLASICLPPVHHSSDFKNVNETPIIIKTFTSIGKGLRENVPELVKSLEGDFDIELVAYDIETPGHFDSFPFVEMKTPGLKNKCDTPIENIPMISVFENSKITQPSCSSLIYTTPQHSLICNFSTGTTTSYLIDELGVTDVETNDNDVGALHEDIPNSSQDDSSLSLTIDGLDNVRNREVNQNEYLMHKEPVLECEDQVEQAMQSQADNAMQTQMVDDIPCDPLAFPSIDEEANPKINVELSRTYYHDFEDSFVDSSNNVNNCTVDQTTEPLGESSMFNSSLCTQKSEFNDSKIIDYSLNDQSNMGNEISCPEVSDEDVIQNSPGYVREFSGSPISKITSRLDDSDDAVHSQSSTPKVQRKRGRKRGRPAFKKMKMKFVAKISPFDFVEFEEGGIMVCGTCDAVCENKPAFRLHISEEHNGLAMPKGLNQDIDKRLHRKIYTAAIAEAGQLKCQQCCSSFKSTLGFIYHINNSCPEIFTECPICCRKVEVTELEKHKEIHVDDPEETILKTKRRSAIKSLEKINSLVYPLESVIHDFDSKCKRIVNNYLPRQLERGWQKAIESNMDAECTRQVCPFKSRDLQECIKHYRICTKRNPSYICKLCYFISSDHEEMSSHVQGPHGDDYLPPEIYDEGEPIVPKEGRQKLHNSHRSRIGIVELMSKFVDENYSHDLFRNFECAKSDWIPLSESEASLYNPSYNSSPYFKYSNDEQKGRDFSWERIPTYRGSTHNGGAILFAGGPITACAWCPMPKRAPRSNQYVALSASLEADKQHSNDKVFSKNGLIQLWGCDLDNDAPSFCFCIGIAHSFGDVHSLEWCPSGIYEDCKTQDMNRLGIVSAGFSDGSVRLFTLPHPKNLSVDCKIFKKEPDLTLLPCTQPDAQCSKVSWFPGKMHSYMAASFFDGTVCVWNLSNPSPLLRGSDSEGRSALFPYISFQAHHGVCTAISFCPLTNGDHIVTAGYDRLIKFWDLSNTDHPLASLRKGIVTDCNWLPYWAGPISCNDDVFALSKTLTTFRENGYYGASFRRLCGSNASCNSLAVSHWLNSVLQVDEAGEILIGFHYSLNCDIENDKNAHKRRIHFGKIDLQNLETGEILSLKDEYNSTSLLYANDEKLEKSKTAVALQTNLRDHPKLFSSSINQFGVIISEETKSKILQQFVQTDPEKVKLENLEPGPLSIYPFMGINSASWNNNIGSHTWAFLGMNCGLGKLVNLSFLGKDVDKYIVQST